MHSPDAVEKMRVAARFAADALVFAEGLVKVGALTDDIDAAIRQWLFDQGRLTRVGLQYWLGGSEKWWCQMCGLFVFTFTFC